MATLYFLYIFIRHFIVIVVFCFRLKLYLEQFKIPACVLNSELPAAVRCLAVNQFNKDVYQIIIASDEKALEKPDGGLPVPLETEKKRRMVYHTPIL